MTELHISRCGVVSQLVGVYKISGLILKGVTFSVLNRKTSRNNPCKQCSKSKEGARAHIYSVIIGTCIHACMCYIRIVAHVRCIQAIRLLNVSYIQTIRLLDVSSIQTIRLLNVHCIQTIRLLDVSSIQTIRLLNVHCIQTIRLLNIRQLAGAASLGLLFWREFPGYKYMFYSKLGNSFHWSKRRSEHERGA